MGGNNSKKNVPADQIFSIRGEMNIFWEVELFTPVHDLAISLVCVLTAKWWVSDQAFKHDSTQGPPITLLSISLLQKDLGCNVVRRADGGIGLKTFVVKMKRRKRRNQPTGVQARLFSGGQGR